MLNNLLSAGPIGRLYSPDNFVSCQSGAGGNCVRGHFTEGLELIDMAQEAIRREVESCDCIQGFQICHSISGGNNSGLGTILLSKVNSLLFKQKLS